MSYLANEIKKHTVLIQTNCYHIEQQTKSLFDDLLSKHDMSDDTGVALLDTLGEISFKTNIIKEITEDIGVLLNIVKDLEKEVGYGKEEEVQKAERLL